MDQKIYNAYFPVITELLFSGTYRLITICYLVSTEAEASTARLNNTWKRTFAKPFDALMHQKVWQTIQRAKVPLHITGSGKGEEDQHCLEPAAKKGGSVTVHGQRDQQELARLRGYCHLFILDFTCKKAISN